MFIQIIQGMCTDEARLRSLMDTWRESLAPGAQGWLGGTYGMTDDGEFVGVVRFDSAQAAARNSARPEQQAWWDEASRCFAGDVAFHDCEDVTMFLGGGSDDAGFVQVIQGRLSDPAGYRRLMSSSTDMLHVMRPEILGGTLAIGPDGWFTETIAFSTEAQAREGERTEMPADAQAEWSREMELVEGLTYKDLHHPWFASAPTTM